MPRKTPTAFSEKKGRDGTVPTHSSLRCIYGSLYFRYDNISNDVDTIKNKLEGFSESTLRNYSIVCAWYGTVRYGTV
jgi:hypothetical protein